jgi:hypothetical protein
MGVWTYPDGYVRTSMSSPRVETFVRLLGLRDRPDVFFDVSNGAEHPHRVPQPSFTSSGGFSML